MRRMVFVLPTLLVLGMMALGLAGCATENTNLAEALATLARPPIGPKKRIAVARFDASAVAAQYGGGDTVGGLAAQLTTALVNSGHFIVVERTELAGVLREQEMALQKIVSKETAAQVGGVLGAQLLVAASVTEFNQAASGGGFRVGGGGGGGSRSGSGFGIGIPGLGGGLGGALGLETVSGVVGIDIRLIDTSTGQVLQSYRAEATVEQRGVSADVDVKQVSFGGDAFKKTALGEATRQAIDKAVAFVIRSMGSVPWTGRIVEVTGDQGYINAGTNAGGRLGDVFTVTVVVKELKDPGSGAVLATVEDKKGEIEVLNVQEKLSIARMRTPFSAQRGDLVKFSGP